MEVKKLYAKAAILGMVENGSHEDAFHQLVYGLTGKESVKALIEQEFQRVDEELSKRLRPQSLPGMITSAQRSQVWRLMYKLSELSSSKVSKAERLAGAVRSVLSITASVSDPLLWVSKSDASKLIARLEKYVESAQRKQAKHDESG
ncbi:MAG: regulatory protein GemA [Ruminococcus sp.]|nr:regulatory protein GemA [Ruminococcus sp.]